MPGRSPTEHGAILALRRVTISCRSGNGERSARRTRRSKRTADESTYGREQVVDGFRLIGRLQDEERVVIDLRDPQVGADPVPWG